jgi:hypothetical protein
MRRRLFGPFSLCTFTLIGCYFKTPTHPADGDDRTPSPAVADAGNDLDAEVAVLIDAGVAPLEGDTGADPRCACSPAKPICIAATKACVQCTADNECSPGAFCQTSPSSSLVNTCVECRQESDCAVGKHCLVETGQCVGCLAPAHCAALPLTNACDQATHQCRACAADAECANTPGRSVCHAGACVQCAGEKRGACGEDQPACNVTSSTCEACKADGDCTRFGKVCDEASAKCVACTPDTEAARCGSKSCNPATFTCTDTTRASVDVCLPCVADWTTNHKAASAYVSNRRPAPSPIRRGSRARVSPRLLAPTTAGSRRSARAALRFGP